MSIKRAGHPVPTPEMLAEICEKVADGWGMRRICEHPRLPSRSTVRKWLREIPEFARLYAQARVAQAEAMDDKILDLVESTNNKNAQANRVKIDALKWRASHLNRGVYGDAVSHEINAQLRLSDAIAASLAVSVVQAPAVVLPATQEREPIEHKPDEDEELLK